MYRHYVWWQYKTLWQSRNYNRIRNSLLPVKEGPLHLKGYCHTNTVAHWTSFQFTTIQFHIEPFQGGLLVGGTGLPTTFLSVCDAHRKP